MSCFCMYQRGQSDPLVEVNALLPRQYFCWQIPFNTDVKACLRGSRQEAEGRGKMGQDNPGQGSCGSQLCHKPLHSSLEKVDALYLPLGSHESPAWGRRWWCAARGPPSPRSSGAGRGRQRGQRMDHSILLPLREAPVLVCNSLAFLIRNSD